MIYIIPITGDAGCGKTYLYERVKEFCGDEATYIDTSYQAKKLFENIKELSNITTPELESAIASKTNDYRNALKSVISILDSFGLRFKYVTQIIEKRIDSCIENRKCCNSDKVLNLYIFINVRELDFIKRIYSYCDAYRYKFFLILMTDKNSPVKSDLDIDSAKKLCNELVSNAEYQELASHTLYIQDSLSCVYTKDTLSKLLGVFNGEIPMDYTNKILHQENCE